MAIKHRGTWKGYKQIKEGEISENRKQVQTGRRDREEAGAQTTIWQTS